MKVMKAKVITLEEELKAALEIRKEVFVEEQGVAAENEYDEFDTLHGPCQHVLVYHGGKPVGTGRVRVIDDYGKLERICVLKPYRKLGVGKVIMAALEKVALKQGVSRVKIHGQTQAEGFYKKLGYQRVSDVFMEEGIPHVVMVKEC